MPIYDYLCNACKKPFEIFLSYSDYGKKRVLCPHCNSTDIRRKLSKPRVMKSDDSRMESLASDFSDPAALAGLENDPQAMGKMMRKMGSEMGEELPAEFNEVVDRLEKGQSPDEIEKAIPDMGSMGVDDSNLSD
jgi:putative FmdB family regulatory protein